MLVSSRLPAPNVRYNFEHYARSSKKQGIVPIGLRVSLQTILKLLDEFNYYATNRY